MIRLSVCIFIFIFNLLQYFSEVTYILNFVSSGTYKLFYWCKKGTLLHSPLSLKLGLQARPRPNIYIWYQLSESDTQLIVDTRPSMIYYYDSYIRICNSTRLSDQISKKSFGYLKDGTKSISEPFDHHAGNQEIYICIPYLTWSILLMHWPLARSGKPIANQNK